MILTFIRMTTTKNVILNLIQDRLKAIWMILTFVRMTVTDDIIN